MDSKQSYQGQYGLYTDLTMSPISLPTVMNYANVISIVADSKLGITETTNKQWYHGLIIDEEKLNKIKDWVDRIDAALTILETLFYLWPNNVSAELDANQYIGNTKAFLNSAKGLLNIVTPIKIEELDPNGKFGITKSSIEDLTHESVTKNMPFWGLILNSGEFQTGEEKKKILPRILYKYFASQKETSSIKEILSESDFVGIIERIQTKNKSLTITDKKMLIKIQQMLTSEMAIVSIKKALYSDMPKAVEIMLGNFNAVSNMMNSLTGEQNFFEATFFLIKQFLTAQIKAMASDLGANATELLAKQLSAKIAKSLVPGSNIASLALTANELISFGKDAAFAPKYVPFTVEYNYDDIKNEHQVIFDEPESCNFSMFTYLYDVPDEDLAANAKRILLYDLIMDNNFPIDPDDGYFVGQDKTILMRTPENGALFYHDFYIGENIDKTLFESKIRQHPIVKVGIDAHRSQKGMLIDDLNLPRTEMNAKDYIDTVTIDNKDFAVIDFSEMFYDSKNPFYKKVYHALNPMKSDNKTYLKLEGHDIYTLSAIIEFTDFTGHQGGIDGSVFKDTIKVYMPNEVYRNNVSIKLIHFNNIDDIMKWRLAHFERYTIHTYLFDETAITVECIDDKEYITNSSHEWVRNSSLKAAILIVDDILHKYLQDKYSGNEAKIARALKNIFTNQGSDSYVLAYDPVEIEILEDTFDFDDFQNLAYEDNCDEKGEIIDEEQKYGEFTNTGCQVTSKSINISQNTSQKIELIAMCAHSNEIDYIVEKQPKNGLLTVTGNVATYTPNTDFLGEDSFTYIANNGVDNSEPGVISITILDIILTEGLVAYYPFDGDAKDKWEWK
jgi:hypothetical protein